MIGEYNPAGSNSMRQNIGNTIGNTRLSHQIQEPSQGQGQGTATILSSYNPDLHI